LGSAAAAARAPLKGETGDDDDEDEAVRPERKRQVLAHSTCDTLAVEPIAAMAALRRSRRLWL
jgi:hypothetical protein